MNHAANFRDLLSFEILLQNLQFVPNDIDIKLSVFIGLLLLFIIRVIPNRPFIELFFNVLYLIVKRGHAPFEIRIDLGAHLRVEVVYVEHLELALQPLNPLLQLM